jgi:NAD(P)-dependent dehydrogenase (short-subunit alcohol dehydrogenase family)
VSTSRSPQSPPGHAVIATARNAESIAAALGEHQDLLAVQLDVTDEAETEKAVRPAIARFGRIDVLVNNAGSFKAGFLEEISPEDFRSQVETTLSSAPSISPGPCSTDALPTIGTRPDDLLDRRDQRGRRLHDPLRRLEVRSRGLHREPDFASFGIRTLVVEPGFFRTELLSPQSTSTRRPPSRTTPNAPPQQPQRGRAWTVNGLATPENSPTLC